MSGPPPPYVMLNENGYGSVAQPPPYRRNAPRYSDYNEKRSGGSCCFRCICCCYCCIFLFIIILTIITFYLYTAFQPKVPAYNVMGLEVKAFDVQPDFSLNTEFLVTVKAENPNDNIGFIYGRDSYVIVTYTDTNLCTGKLPSFRQGHKNTTIMAIDLKGKSEFGSGLQEAFTENKKHGKIPLLVRVKVPVIVVFGDFPLREFIVFVNCSLVVDNLAPNQKIGILSKETTYNFQF